MHLFYAPDLDDNIYELSEEESKHCIKVLRLKKNDYIHLTDGRGNLFKARIIVDKPDKCRVEVTETQREYEKRPFHLHIGIAPTKNDKRFEWFLEKCTEIGVDEITPLLCFHSERKYLKTERSNRVITSAMKQSLKAFHPVLHEMVSFSKFVSSQQSGKKYIAYPEMDKIHHVKHLYTTGSNVTILIGPEGDFSPQEFQHAKENGFVPVSLGRSRLRSETAGIVACSIFNLMNE
jgi:16S rRNA (uracil1498-N3)-methyltransferase